MDYVNLKVEKEEEGIDIIKWEMKEKQMNVLKVDEMKEMNEIIDEVIDEEKIKGVVIK